MNEEEISINEIVEYIKNLDKGYRENIFWVENAVRHTLEFLAKRKFIDIEIKKKTKIKRDKTKKVDIFKNE